MKSGVIRKKLFNSFTKNMEYYKEEIIDSFVLCLGEKYKNQIENRINSIIFVPYINGPEYTEYFFREVFLKKLEITNLLMEDLGYCKILDRLYISNDHCTIKPKDEETKKLLNKYFGDTFLLDLKTDIKLFKNKKLFLELAKQFREKIYKLNELKCFDDDEFDNIFDSCIGMFSYSGVVDEDIVYSSLEKYNVKGLVPSSILSSVLENRTNTVVVFPLLLVNNQTLFHEIEHCIETTPLLFTENEDETILYYKSGLCILDTTANLDNNSSAEEDELDEIYTEIISREVSDRFKKNIFSFIIDRDYYFASIYSNKLDKYYTEYYNNRSDIVSSKVTLNKKYKKSN